MPSRVRIVEDVRQLSGKVHIAATGYKIQVVQPGTTTAVTVYQAATGGSTHSWFGTDSTGMIAPFNADPATTGTAIAGGEMWADKQPVELRVLTLANVEVTRERLELVSAADALSVESGIGLVLSSVYADGVTNATTAIQAAIDTVSTAGGGTVTLPRGSYLLNSLITPKSGVILRGVGATIRTSYTGAAIYAQTTAFTDFAVEDITFEGPVTEVPTAPKRARTTSGAGLETAVSLDGDLNTSGSGQATLTNFTMRNCKVRKCTGLPILIRGVHGTIRVTGCEFDNNMDVGFTFNEEVIFNGNHVTRSADNGVSLSRGNRKVACVGNTFDNCCYHGIFASGFLTDKGPQNVTINGNIVRNVGLAGVYVDAAAKYGTITGNDLDGGFFRGPSDDHSDSACVGIFIGGYPTDNRAVPTDWAEGWVVSGNHVRQFPRAGVLMQGVRRTLVIGNQISDVGTQFLADGTTAISSADVTQNVGILMDNPTTSSVVVIALNHVADSRVTPYLNWAIVPVGSGVADEFFNTMVNARNAYNLIETGSTRNINYGAVFQQNSKHTAGATAGASAATGNVAGFDINGAAGSARRHKIQTAGSDRWQYGANGTAEGGSNAGTDFVLKAYDDSGLATSDALFAQRSSSSLVLNLWNMDTTGKTSAQIDAALPSGVTARDGLFIRDATNNLLVVRQGGKWNKTAVLTQIA